MDDMGPLRELGADTEAVDAETRQTARDALLAAIEAESSGSQRQDIPQGEMSTRRRRLGVRGAVALGLVLLAPAAYGAAELSGTIFGAMELSADDCPNATRAFEAAGLKAPTEYADECPTPDRVEQVIRELKRDEGVPDSRLPG